MKCFYSYESKTYTPRTRYKHKNMSSNNNNNRLATFELAEFNRNPQNNNTSPPKNATNKDKPAKVDYTGFNHDDFVTWAKSSTGKPFNQPQINADVQRADRQRVANEWFDYDAFIALAKSQLVQD